MNKIDLRWECLLKRKCINDKDKLSRIIVDKIIKLPIYQKSKIIALYRSMYDEVDTNYLINYSLKCGKIVLLPKVIGNDLVFLRINKYTEYQKSNFGVMEPIYKVDDVYTGMIDLAVIPGVAFDCDNNRLGYGKGYYDRFLKLNSCFKIGICFSSLMVKSVDANNLDVKMDLVINDKN